MTDPIVPAMFVAVPFVITLDASGIRATYGFASDDGDDPRTNLSLPFGLKATR